MSKEAGFLFLLNILFSLVLLFYIMSIEEKLNRTINTQSKYINKIDQRIESSNGIVDNLNNHAVKINSLWERINTIKK